MVKVLLLEDEQALREEIADYLRGQGFEVTEVGSIRQFRQFFFSAAYDLVVIDRMLPDGDGLELVSELRQEGHRCGILVLTARDSSQDRIGGYRIGADHYISKPVRMDELTAVIQSIAWRILPNENWWLESLTSALISPRSVKIKLTSQEFQFLETLGRISPKPLSRHQIAAALGKDLSNYDTRSLDAMVMRLRKKVSEQTDEILPLRTHHGSGYSSPTSLKMPPL
jgi:two-component system OmpR family response regulator